MRVDGHHETGFVCEGEAEVEYGGSSPTQER